jgi:UDP-N-acetylmuramate dehydrogenase
MLLQPDDAEARSAGSFFKNPILSQSAVLDLEQKARAAGLLADSEKIPTFPAGSDKGCMRGNAGISKKHALAIVNLGGASAQEIVDLMHDIQERVFHSFNVELKPEPVFLGF